MAMVAEDIVLYSSAAASGYDDLANQRQRRRQRAAPANSGDNSKHVACRPEPSIFTCGTCKSVYSSSWFLVQHVQKTHGIKIYEEPQESPPAPARPIVVQPENLLAEQLSAKDAPPPTSFHSTKRHHHSPPTSGASSRSPRGGDMFSFPMPFMPGAPRQPSMGSWPYNRSHMGSEFAAMMNTDMMMDQLRRIQGMMGADHMTGMPGYLRPALDTQYSHSERLRLLAATGAGGTSPKSMAATGSSIRKEFSPTQSTPPSAFSTPTSASHDSSTSGKQLKQCEFCKKQFKFTSNLVLHRRLHTGEKPYSCPLCSFTSAQATKLQSHMRCHAPQRSSLSSPVSDPHKLSESDIEDSEDFVQKEAEAEAAIRQLQQEAAKKQKEDIVVEDNEERPTDLSQNSSRPRSRESISPQTSDDMVTDRASLLTEVMMKTGLSSLPNYKEAFTAALAEVPGHNKSPQSSPKPTADKPEEDEVVARSPVKDEANDSSLKDESMTDGDVETENGSLVDDESRSVASLRHSPQSHASSDYSSGQPPEKRIKHESSPSTTPSFPASQPVDPLFQRAAIESLYPGIWFPPTSGAFPPFMGGRDHPLLSASARLTAAAENGISSSNHSQQSAFSSSGSPKLPSPGPSTPTNVGSGCNTPGSSLRPKRNDTCEFCGKVFRNCSNLTVHRRSHTGEKPYKCQLCPYACAQSSKLTRHMRTHGRTGKDVFRCKFCCMPFSVPSTLEKHMRKCVENQQRAAAAARHPMVNPLATPSTV